MFRLHRDAPRAGGRPAKERVGSDIDVDLLGRAVFFVLAVASWFCVSASYHSRFLSCLATPPPPPSLALAEVEIALNACAEACLISDPSIEEMLVFKSAFDHLRSLVPIPGHMPALLAQAKIPRGSMESVSRFVVGSSQYTVVLFLSLFACPARTRQ